jgi:hypothetical protein
MHGMKKLSLSLLIMALPMILGATTVTFNDAFGSSTSGDVLGDKDKFDIQKVVVGWNSSSTNVQIYLDYGASNLGQFYVGSDALNVGDLFFTVNGTISYALVLKNHDGLTAGTIYSISNVAAATDTAWDELHSSNTSGYRPDEIVRLSGTNVSSYATGSAPSVVNTGNNGTDTGFNPGATYLVSYSLSSDFIDSLGSNWGIHFAAATCGNDIIDGSHSSGVPEPLSMVLFGSGLLGLGLLRRRIS